MSMVQIDHAHYQIHAGLSFLASRIATAVANGANHDIRFKTGANACHVQIDVSCSAKSQFLIYEGATISAGTAIDVKNSNRASTRTATATITHTPTVTATGSNIILNRLIGTGSSGAPVLGSPGGRIEFIFKPNTEYLLRNTNTSGTAADMNTVISFYEVE